MYFPVKQTKLKSIGQQRKNCVFLTLLSTWKEKNTLSYKSRKNYCFLFLISMMRYYIFHVQDEINFGNIGVKKKFLFLIIIRNQYFYFKFLIFKKSVEVIEFCILFRKVCNIYNNKNRYFNISLSVQNFLNRLICSELRDSAARYLYVQNRLRKRKFWNF